MPQLLRSQKIRGYAEEKDAFQAARLQGPFEIAVKGVAFEKSDLVNHVLAHGVFLGCLPAASF